MRPHSAIVQSCIGREIDFILFDKIGSKFKHGNITAFVALLDDAETTITDCIENIRYVSDKFGCDVMIVETGFYVDESRPEILEEGRRQLARVIRESLNETGGRCKGVFYWEPQCRPSQYRLGAFTEDGRPTVIMDAFRDWSE